MRLVDGPPAPLTSSGDAWPSAATAAPAAGAITRRLDSFRTSTLPRLSAFRTPLVVLLVPARGVQWGSSVGIGPINPRVFWPLRTDNNFRSRSFHPTDHAAPQVVQPLFWLPYPCSRIWYLGCRRGNSSQSLRRNPFCLEVWLSVHRHCLGVRN